MTRALLQTVYGVPVSRPESAVALSHHTAAASDAEVPVKWTVRDWDVFFLNMAVLASSMSKDPDRQVGAVFVSADRRQVSFGYNGFPPEVEDLPSRLNDKAFKLAHMVHAEVNGLRQAPFDLTGGTGYVTRFPCQPCAQKLGSSGIIRLVTPWPDFGHARWGSSWRKAAIELDLSGLVVDMLSEAEWPWPGGASLATRLAPFGGE